MSGHLHLSVFKRDLLCIPKLSDPSRGRNSLPQNPLFSSSSSERWIKSTRLFYGLSGSTLDQTDTAESMRLEKQQQQCLQGLSADCRTGVECGGAELLWKLTDWNRVGGLTNQSTLGSSRGGA
uniref:Uncharacterized protein n=1 Tax=Pygocentrus nattereri TaxID=42514 RepID=A0AAR2ISI8_PYGNA